VADQSNLTATVSIADIAAETENDWWESVRKLAQAHDMSAETVHAALMRICSSQRSRSGGWPKRLYLEMKKERFRTCEAAVAMAAAVPWHLRQRSHCWGVGRGRRASWLASFSFRRPPRGAEMGVRNKVRRRTLPRRSGANESAAWDREGRRRPYEDELKIQNGLITTEIFYIQIFRKSCIHTSYVCCNMPTKTIFSDKYRYLAIQS
jgi:hypothetical protein